MTNTQMLLSIGIPTLTILVGIWRSDKRFDAIHDELRVVPAELRFFHGVTGELKGRIDTIEKRS